jgi:hypothetical protein
MPRIFKSRSDILVTELDFLLVLRICHNSLTGKFVVVYVKLNPFACLFRECRNAGVELILALAEDINVLGLSFLFVRF